MRIICAIALEISIKLNEQMVLSLEDVAALFENKFSVQMLCQLERHILMMNQFRINVATPLDFVLHFTIGEREFLERHGKRPEVLTNICLPLLHFAMSQYTLSRRRYSSIAIAAICQTMQQIAEMRNAAETRNCRDQWLTILVTKYDEIDLAEVYDILCEFSQASGSRASQHGNDEFLRTPWDFQRVRRLSPLMTSEINEINAVIDYELMLLPDIGKLSLEG